MIVVLDEAVRNVTYDSDIVRVTNIQNLMQLQGTIDALVIGEFGLSKLPVRDRITFTDYIQKMSSTARVSYIHSPSNADDGLISLIVGVGGVVEENTRMLDTSAGIRRVAEGRNYAAIESTDSVKVLNDFFDNFKSGTLTKGQVSLLNSSVSEVVDLYQRKDQTLKVVSSAGIRQTAQMKEQLNKAQSDMDRIKELARKVTEANSHGRSVSPSAGITAFPSFSIPLNRSRLYILIKDLGRTRYLTHFVEGLSEYIQRTLLLTPKTVFLEPTGVVYVQRYKDGIFIDQDSYTKSEAISEPLLHLNFPTEEAVNRIIRHDKFKAVIIVDRLISQLDHIVKMDGKTPIYACASRGWYDTRGAGNRKLPWFTSVVTPSTAGNDGFLGCIPTFRGYDELTLEMRRQAYASQGELYKKIIEASGYSTSSRLGSYDKLAG